MNQREQFVTIRLVEQLNVTCLIVSQYQDACRRAIECGGPAPLFPHDALIPSAEDAIVVAEKTTIIKIPVIAPKLRRRKAQQSF